MMEVKTGECVYSSLKKTKRYQRKQLEYLPKGSEGCGKELGTGFICSVALLMGFVSPSLPFSLSL